MEMVTPPGFTMHDCHVEPVERVLQLVEADMPGACAVEHKIRRKRKRARRRTRRKRTRTRTRTGVVLVVLVVLVVVAAIQ